MAFICKIYKADVEHPLVMEELSRSEDISHYFREYSWDSSFKRQVSEYTASFKLINTENDEYVSLISIDSKSEFQVLYNKTNLQIGTRPKYKQSLMVFQDFFNLDQACEIIVKFIDSPESLLEYEQQSEHYLGKKNIAFGWLLYALLLFFFGFIFYSLITEKGFNKEALIILAILVIIAFIMIRFRPKKE